MILQAKKKKAQENNSDSEASTETKETEKQEEPIVLRPLNMEDMRQAKNQVTN